jgi:hypothetical protein
MSDEREKLARRIVRFEKITELQKELRHSDPRITLGIYSHVIGDQQRNAVQNRSARLVN